MKVLNFLNTKAKATVVFLFSMIFLGVFILSSLAATAVCREWHGLVIGIALMVIAIIPHLLGKKSALGYIVAFLINAVGVGFSVSAYYLSKNIPIEPYDLILAAIPAAGILFLVYMMLQILEKTKTVTVTIACIINAALAIAPAVLWIMQGHVFFSFAFFCSIISFFFLCVFAITVGHDERSVLRDISFGGFGSFVIITVVVIFILSSGDLLDGFDFGIGDGTKKKKKK